MVIDTRDFKGCSEEKRIYVHSCSKKDMKVYKQMGIGGEGALIKETEKGST